MAEKKPTLYQHGTAVVEEMRKKCEQGDLEVERIDRAQAENAQQRKALAAERSETAVAVTRAARTVKSFEADPRLAVDSELASRYEQAKLDEDAARRRFQDIEIEHCALAAEETDLKARREAAARRDGKLFENGRRAALKAGLKFITDAPAYLAEPFAELAAANELERAALEKIRLFRLAVTGPVAELIHTLPTADPHAKRNLQDEILYWLDLRRPGLRWLREPAAYVDQAELDSILGQMTDGLHAIADRVDAEGVR